MSSSFLHDKISHSILFPNQPFFYLPPCVFGCVCFVHILTPGQDKLSTKATKCVFLGYSRLQRGYCYYSPNTHRYFVSADVTFLRTLLCSLLPTQPFLMSYLYPFFIPSWIHLMYLRLLHLDHYRFILVAHVLTLSLQLTHLLWRPPLQRQSCRLPLIFPLPFGKVLIPLITPILFIIS